MITPLVVSSTVAIIAIYIKKNVQNMKIITGIILVCFLLFLTTIGKYVNDDTL